MTEFSSYLISGIMNGAIYSMIALGFVLIYKCSGIFNLAQGELVILGAYFFYMFGVQLGWPIWACFIATIIVATLLGLGIQQIVIRPLLGQPLLSLAIATLLMAGIFQAAIIIIWGTNTLSLPKMFPTGGVKILGATLSYEHVAFFIISVTVVVILLLFFRYSKLGVEMMATSEDTRVARGLGINVKGILAFSWIVSCWVSAIGGILMSSVIGVSYSAAGIGLRAISCVLLGGLESLGGVMLAGPIVGAVEFLAAGYIDPLVGGGFRDIAAFIVMILVLLVRPQGLFGWKKIERV